MNSFLCTAGLKAILFFRVPAGLKQFLAIQGSVLRRHGRRRGPLARAGAENQVKHLRFLFLFQLGVSTHPTDMSMGKMSIGTLAMFETLMWPSGFLLEK